MLPLILGNLHIYLHLLSPALSCSRVGVRRCEASGFGVWGLMRWSWHDRTKVCSQMSYSINFSKGLYRGLYEGALSGLSSGRLEV